MTVKIQFAKNAKTTHVFTQVHDKAESLEIAQKSSGMVKSLRSVLGKNTEPAKLVDYSLRYYPFWHVQAESIYEYKRKNSYQFPVSAEVQSVTVGKKVIKIEPGSGSCQFEAEDHCFEHYQKEVIQDALKEKGRQFAKYLASDSKKIKSLDVLQKKDAQVPLIQIRASYVLSKIYKEILKPVHADKVLDARIVVNSVALYLIPMHVFVLDENGKQKTYLVDAVTGVREKDSSMIAQLTQQYWSGETVFDISSELAASILPGAGVGMILAKKAYEKRQKGKQAKKRASFRSAYKKKKK
jgi:hypothetical protein